MKINKEDNYNNHLKYFNNPEYDDDEEEYYQENEECDMSPRLPLYEYSGSAINFLDKITQNQYSNKENKCKIISPTNNATTNQQPNLKIKISFEVRGQKIIEVLNTKDSIIDFANKLANKYSIPIETILQNLFKTNCNINNNNNTTNENASEKQLKSNSSTKSRNNAKMKDQNQNCYKDENLMEGYENENGNYNQHQQQYNVELTENFLDSDRTISTNNNYHLRKQSSNNMNNIPINASISTIQNNNFGINSNNYIGSGSSINRIALNLDATRYNNTNSKSTSGNVINIGERLMHKGVATKNRSMSKVKNLSSKKEDELKNCTFSPKINKSSMMISIQSKYLQSNDKSNTKNEEVKNDQPTMEDYYIESHKPPNTGNGATWRTEKLYQDHEKFTANKEKYREFFYANKYRFTPNINDKTPSDINRFYDRLQNWVEKRNEKYLKEIDSANYDAKTGERLFSPKINKYNPKKTVTTTNTNTKQEKEITIEKDIGKTMSTDNDEVNKLIKKLITNIIGKNGNYRLK